MMMKFFWSSDEVSKSTLDARVDSDIISVAIEEGLIALHTTMDRTQKYRRTEKGRSFVK
jgi:predicted transcriptional regulator